MFHLHTAAEASLLYIPSSFELDVGELNTRWRCTGNDDVDVGVTQVVVAVVVRSNKINIYAIWLTL